MKALEPPEDCNSNQYARLLDLLWQEEYWGRPGQRVLVSGLEPEHVDNITYYLLRQAHSLRLEAALHVASGLEPRSDIARDMLDSARAGLHKQSAEEWLEETPLMARLRELQSQRSTDGSL